MKFHLHLSIKIFNKVMSKNKNPLFAEDNNYITRFLVTGVDQYLNSLKRKGNSVSHVY